MIKYALFRRKHIGEVLQLWIDIPGIYLQSGGSDSVEGLKSYLKRNRGYSFIAKDNKKIVGSVLCGHDGRNGFIHHLAVVPGYQRQGIGKKLLSLALEKLKRSKINKCALFTLKNNKEAALFYRNIKWEKLEIAEVYFKEVEK